LIVSIKLFAAARELAGQSEVTLKLPPGADVAELRQTLAAELPALSPLTARSLIALNAEYAADNNPITEGDDLALIPPVSGG
jgi:molybdopterin converting factor subunit 1